MPPIIEASRGGADPSHNAENDAALPRGGRRLGSPRHQRRGSLAESLSTLARSAVPLVLLPLASCNQLVLLDPKGAIGEQEKDLILIASGLMLLVVIPVMVLTLVFAWRYRAGNTNARYSPTWSHSTKIEVVVWTIPILIVATLAALIWRTTHALDPYRPLTSEVPPINVEVVALDWKWLFIYPDYGIATVNSLTVPVGTPINFRLTSASMMNSFFIPQLGSQIYAMAGMQTKLHLIADVPGTYAGRSSAFSGPGFSDMRFDTVAVPPAAFETWVQSARTAFATQVLDDATYRALARPSVKAPPALYGRVSPGLFDSIVDAFMAGRMSKLAFNEALCTVDGPLSRRLN